MQEVPEPLSLEERLESHRPIVVEALAPFVGRERVKRLLCRVDAWRYDERGRGDPEAIERVHERHGDTVPEPSDIEREKVDAALADYHDVSVDYSAVSVPSFHLYGEYEIPWVRRHACFMAETLPNGELQEIPDAGHVSMVDNPEFVVDALRAFLAKS